MKRFFEVPGWLIVAAPVIIVVALVFGAFLVGASRGERELVIDKYELKMQMRMVSLRNAQRVCAFKGGSMECADAFNEFVNKDKWLTQARAEIAKLDPPMTVSEKKKAHDDVMHSVNAELENYAPPFTDKDFAW